MTVIDWTQLHYNNPRIAAAVTVANILEGSAENRR